MAMGFSHVQSSPLTRSSYHAREAVEASRPAGDFGVWPGPEPPDPGDHWSRAVLNQR